jgi:hypothetical protein
MKRKKVSKKTQFERKIREYRQVLKSDEDWDWAYILLLLKYKLERTRKCIVSNDIIVGAKRVGRQIAEVERLLDRVAADRYYEEISKDFRKRYGRLRIQKSKHQTDGKSSQIKMLFTRETPRNTKRVRREFVRLHRKAEAMQRAELRRAFNLMSKDIFGWWD